MSPVKIIIYQSITQYLSFRVVRFLLVVLGILLFVSMYTSYQLYRSHNQKMEAYHEQSVDDFVNNPDKHPHRMAHFGHYAFRPKSLMSVFDPGIENYMGNTIFLEAHVQNSTNFSEAAYSTGLIRFGDLSPAMLLQFILPLILVFMGFGSISSDRQNGTLKILLSQGTSWKQLLLGKILSLFMISWLILMMTLLIMAVLMIKNTIEMGQWYAWAGIGITYSIYLFICCSVIVLISAQSKTSASSLVGLLGCWLIFAILLPRGFQSVGKLIYKQPSKAVFLTALEADVMKEGDSHNPDDPHYKALKDSILRKYNVDSIEQLPFNYGGFQITEGERISAQIYNKHYGKVIDIHHKQNRLSYLQEWFNPILAIKNASMAWSSTDYKSFQDFQKQAEDYRYLFVQQLNSYHMSDISNKAINSAGHTYVSSKDRWKETPEFVYNTMSLLQLLKNSFWPSLALCIWLGLVLYIIFNKVFTAI